LKAKDLSPQCESHDTIGELIAINEKTKAKKGWVARASELKCLIVFETSFESKRGIPWQPNQSVDENVEYLSGRSAELSSGWRISGATA
jgi:hypothetical protein